VQEEATQKLIDGQAHDSLLVGVGGVPPAEGNVTVRECEESAVRDTDAMCVRPEVSQHMLWSAKGWLGVNDPVVKEETAEPGSKAARLLEVCKLAMELELAIAEGLLQTSDELTPEESTEHLHRQEEGTARGDPARMIGCQTASRDDAMHMRVMLQSLVPCMEHAEEADLRAEVPGIAGELLESFRAGMKEQAVEGALVLKGKRRQFTGQREHGVDIASRQQFAFALLEPVQAGVTLASRAMPVAARVIGDGNVSAVRALIAMTAKCSGAAARDRIEDLQVLPVDPAMTAFDEAGASVANDIGHLQRGAA